MKNYRAELTGVFGDPVDDNPTGVVEEAAFAAKNLNYRYLTIKVLPEDLGKAMDSVGECFCKVGQQNQSYHASQDQGSPLSG